MEYPREFEPSPLDSVTEYMLSQSHAVLIYDPEAEDTAREIMERVATGLANRIMISDPTLESLVIFDSKSKKQHWNKIIPGVQLISIADIEQGNFVISRNQSIVALGHIFLSRKVCAPARHGINFFAAISNTAQARLHCEKVQPFSQAIYLKKELS